MIRARLQADLLVAQFSETVARELLLKNSFDRDLDPPRDWAVTCTFSVPLGELSSHAAREAARQRIEQLRRSLPAPGRYVLRCNETDEEEVLV